METFGDILIIPVFIAGGGEVIQIVKIRIAEVDVFDAKTAAAFAGRAVSRDQGSICGGFYLNPAGQIAQTDADAGILSDVRIGAEADPAFSAVKEKKNFCRWSDFAHEEGIDIFSVHAELIFSGAGVCLRGF